MTYKSFQKQRAYQDGRSKSFIDLHEVKCPLSELVLDLHHDWRDYVMHDFHKKWQKTAMEDCFLGLRGNEIATNADFSEKWNVKVRPLLCLLVVYIPSDINPLPIMSLLCPDSDGIHTVLNFPDKI